MKQLGTLLLVACTAFVAACASAPIAVNGIPPRKTSDDCLVLIRTVVINTKSLPAGRTYHLSLGSGYATLTVPNDPEGTMIVMVREPGVKIVRVKGEVNRAQFTGDDYDEDLDNDLPYSRGHVVVADFTFTQTLREVGPNRYLSSFDLQPISEEIQGALLKRFHATPGAETWP
jgi:hypothetical protein